MKKNISKIVDIMLESMGFKRLKKKNLINK